MGISIIGIGLNLLVMILVGAVVLRAAVTLANWILRSRNRSAPPVGQFPNEAEATTSQHSPGDIPTDVPIVNIPVAKVAESSNPYAAPAEYVVPNHLKPIPKDTIPTPNFLRALGIMAVAAMANTVLSLLPMFAMFANTSQPTTTASGLVLVQLVSVIGTFVITMVVLRYMLPTTFLRSLLVMLMMFLVYVFVVTILMGIVFVVTTYGV